MLQAAEESIDVIYLNTYPKVNFHNFLKQIPPIGDFQFWIFFV